MPADEPEGDEAIPELPQITLAESEIHAGLLSASKLGRPRLAARLCELSRDNAVVAVDSRGWAPLHYASFHGHHEVVQVLLRAGAGASFQESSAAATAAWGLGVERSMASPAVGGGAAAAPTATRPARVIDSPLHAAVTRGHLRVVWLLLSAGASPADVDSMGNTALHLAAASSAPPAALRAELVATLLGAGSDPHAKNWGGAIPYNMLPRGPAGAPAARLLARVAAETRCASTGVLFGPDAPRFLCSSTGRCYLEGASVPLNVPAFAPALAGVTLPGGAPRGRTDPPPPDIEGAELGIVVSGAHGSPLIAVWGRDLSITRPVRFGADAAYRVADAEAALEAAMAPHASVAAAAEDTYQAARAASMAASGGGGGDANNLSGAAFGGGGSGGGGDDDSSPQLAVDIDADGDGDGDADELSEKNLMSSPDQADRNDMSGLSPYGLMSSLGSGGLGGGGGGDGGGGGGLGGGGRGEATGGFAASGIGHNSATRTPAAVKRHVPLELYASRAMLITLEAALDAARDVGGNVQLIAAGGAALSRAAAAAVARDDAIALAAARPLQTRDDAALSRAVTSAAAAASAGAGFVFCTFLNIGRALAVTELDIANARVAAERVPIATHTHDAIISRLGSALARAASLAFLATRMASGEEADVPTESEITDAGKVTVVSVVEEGGGKVEGGGGGVGGDDVTPPPAVTPVFRLGLKPLAELMPPIIPVASSLITPSLALEQRLKAEVSLSDVVIAAEGFASAAASAVLAHADEDPTLLPTPELPPTTAAVEVVPAGKGGKPAAKAAPAPPPKPAAKGGKAPPPPTEPPPHPPVDANLPLDIHGVPLPHTPQLNALFALRVGLTALSVAARDGAAAGADAAAVDGARAASVRLATIMAEGLLGEAIRVEAAREAAAKKKKGKGHAKKK
jgi:ankyrin repeat protein